MRTRGLWAKGLRTRGLGAKGLMTRELGAMGLRTRGLRTRVWELGFWGEVLGAGETVEGTGGGGEVSEEED